MIMILEEPIAEETVRRCEAISSIRTGIAQRASLALIITGHRHASTLTLFEWNSMTAEQVTEKLTEAKLYFARKLKGCHPRASIEYAVAADEVSLIKLLEAKAPAEFGFLYGYPETAIRAFCEKNVYDGPLPEDIHSSLITFKFSKEHYREEFEVVRDWNAAIKRFAPRIAYEWNMELISS